MSKHAAVHKRAHTVLIVAAVIGGLFILGGVLAALAFADDPKPEEQPDSALAADEQAYLADRESLAQAANRDMVRVAHRAERQKEKAKQRRIAAREAAAAARAEDAAAEAAQQAADQAVSEPTPVATSPSTPSTSDSGTPSGGGMLPSQLPEPWLSLAKCESGLNPHIISSNGLWFGLFQFTVGTWQGVGGSGLPSDASVEEQLRRAQILQAQSGWGPWPVCAAGF